MREKRQLWYLIPQGVANYRPCQPIGEVGKLCFCKEILDVSTTHPQNIQTHRICVKNWVKNNIAILWFSGLGK